jgi:Ca-activated chloride channel homolog
MPGEVTLAHQVGKDYMPVTGGSQLAYVLLETRPTEMMAQVRMPLNFALVLDHSGSMKGAKLKNVKEAVKMVIDRLEPTDYVSVVIFDDTSQVIIPSMPANDKPGMKAAIDQIRDAGGTTMSLGMIQGLNELRRWNIPHAVNRMILLTDGVTYGDAERCRQLARDAAAAGIGIYTLGIGSDWDEDLLDSVGQMSGSGTPAEFIRDASDALTVFQQQLQSAVDVAIRNATLILRLPVGVSPKKAVLVLPIIKDFGPNVLSDRQIVIPLGDLEKDKPQSVLVELMIDPRPAGLFRIGQAELNYDVPITGFVGESIRDDIKVTFTQDANQAAATNAVVMNFAEKANAHRLVTRVLDEYKRTGKATTRLAPNVTRVLDEETQAALEQINQGQQISQEQVKTIGNKTRKLTQRLDEILP